MSDRNAVKQVRKIFFNQLGGHEIATCPGPNGSQFHLWVVYGRVVIVQIYADNNGWDYYLPGREGKLAAIADDVNEYLEKNHDIVIEVEGGCVVDVRREDDSPLPFRYTILDHDNLEEPEENEATG